MADTPFSLDPDKAIEGGGLPDNFNGEVTGARIDTFEYKGKGSSAVGLVLDLKNLDDPTAILEPVFYSAGSPNEWEATPDNRGLVPLKGQAGMRNSSNIYWFLKHLAEAKGSGGYKLKANDFSALIGMVAYFHRVPPPPREAIMVQRAEAGNTRAQTVLVVKEVRVLPGQKGTTARATTSTAAPTAAADNTDMDTKLRTWILDKAIAAIGEGQPGIKRTALIQVANAQFCKPNGVALNEVAAVLKTADAVTKRLGLFVDKNDYITGEMATD